MFSLVSEFCSRQNEALFHILIEGKNLNTKLFVIKDFTIYNLVSQPGKAQVLVGIVETLFYFNSNYPQYVVIHISSIKQFRGQSLSP